MTEAVTGADSRLNWRLETLTEASERLPSSKRRETMPESSVPSKKSALLPPVTSMPASIYLAVSLAWPERVRLLIRAEL